MIDYSVSDGVATITINDPDRRNPLSVSEMADLLASVSRAASDDAAHVVVITGAGEVFSAGGDLSRDFVHRPLADHEGRGGLANLFREMWMCPKPIVARVNGVALGGGLGVAVAADITIAAEDARLGTPEINVGLWPMMISAVLRVNVPSKPLLDMMLSGRIVSAQEAFGLGLVTQVVPRSDLDAAVDARVAVLREKSPAALALGKRSFYAMSGMDVDTALDHLQFGLTTLAMTDDAREGIDAFVNKRDPEWTGR